jgi:hypothetical protein
MTYVAMYDLVVMQVLQTQAQLTEILSSLISGKRRLGIGRVASSVYFHKCPSGKVFEYQEKSIGIGH